MPIDGYCACHPQYNGEVERVDWLSKNPAKLLAQRISMGNVGTACSGTSLLRCFKGEIAHRDVIIPVDSKGGINSGG